MMFKLLSAKRFALMCRFAKNNMLRLVSVFGLIAGSLFSIQAQATWNQVSGLATIPAAVAVDPNNVGTAYAASSSGSLVSLFRISSLNVGTPTAQQLTVSNMNLSSVSAIVIKPKQVFADNDVILIAGEGPDAQSGGQSAPKVFMLTGVAGSTSFNALDISIGLTGQVGSISQILMTKTGNAYLAHSLGIHRASNITPTSQTANWATVSNTVGKLSIIESATGAGNTLIAVVNQTANGAAPGVYAAAESANAQISFSPVAGLPNLDGQFSYIVSSAVNSSSVSPGVYVSVANNGLYNCRLTSAAGAVTPTLSCTQSGIVGTSNVLTVMAVNSSGVLFGVDSTLNQLKNTTNGSTWNTNESSLPTGFILTDFFFVSGSTVLMATDSGLYYSLTNVLPGTGTSGTTNGTDVEVQSITPSVTQVQPSQQFNTSVTIRNSGTQQIASVTLQMSVTNGSFSTALPQGCTGAGVSVTCSGLTSINTAGQVQTLSFPVIASTANGQTATVTASVQMVGGTDANTVNNIKTANVTISTSATGAGNVTGNRAPVLSGGNNQNIVISLSNKNATTGVLQATDPDVGDVVSFSVTKLPTMGTFTLTGTTWSYLPNSTATASATDFATLTMTDGKTPTTVQLVFSFQGTSSSSGGAVQPLFVLFAMLGMMFMRRKNWV